MDEITLNSAEVKIESLMAARGVGVVGLTSPDLGARQSVGHNASDGC